MCTLLLAHRAHPDYPLVIAANRDEYYRRATAPAEFWASAPQVLAGRDLEAGGTWLGITTAGRWAGLTNIRDPQLHRDSARSRGWLVRDYLLGPARPEHYLAQLAEQRAHYGGFNLLVGDRDDV
ncbi:MAG: NRDE family protein, partial [Myxococcota bacterium]